MRVFIAEKPSLAKAIAAQLPKPHEGGAGQGFIKCGNNDIVTWCFGHILEQAMPDAYGKQYEQFPGTFSILPLLPENWILHPKADAKKQIGVIDGLLKRATEIVNAGDPDREGQMLVDEVLDYLGNKKPVSRIWLAALDPVSVQRALSAIKSNKEYFNLYQAAIARSRADWLVGMNLSRAFTIAARKGGRFGPTVSVGRVQTPTLGLVVARDLEIENFVPKDYYTIEADIKVANGQFKATWKAPKSLDKLDEEGRLLDKKVADEVKARVMGNPSGLVSLYDVTDQKTPPPLPFSLSSLQVYASKAFGYGAQQVLDACQSLYETHQLTSYPRTDCEFLPVSQLADAKIILGNLNSHFQQAQGANAGLKSRTWNDSKVTAHHAIIPTQRKMGNLANLNPTERNIYEAICLRYICQFYPDFRYRQTEVETNFGSDVFRATGRTPVDAGWKAVYGTGAVDEDEEKSSVLPVMAKGDPSQALQVTINAKKTTPPEHFTEGTLIKAMTNVHQFVTDEEIKKRLKEVAGIGTEATRASMIETLLKRNFLEKQGKGKKTKLVSTAAGRALIKALPAMIRDPGMTAVWEGALEAVEHGKMSLDDFLRHQSSTVTKLVRHAETLDISMPDMRRDSKPYAAQKSGGKPGYAKPGQRSYSGSGASQSNRPKPTGPQCPKCKKGVMVTRVAKVGSNAGKEFKGCTNYPECKHAEAMAAA